MQWSSCSPAISIKTLTIYATVSACCGATIRTRLAFAELFTTILMFTNHFTRNAKQ